MFINNDFSNNENSSSTRKRSIGFSRSCWKKKSIFFELEYWKKLHVRHCLDVMHIEKNVCMNLLGTLLDIPGKTKDGLQSRRDLEQLGIRPELVPKVVGNRTYIPPACYTLSKSEKRTVCQSLSKMNVPEGYSSNIKTLVSIDTLKLTGLKSHDCHVLMQQLLSVAIRGALPKHAKERDQNDDIGRPSSAASHIRPEKEQLMQAHLYVLENTNDVQPYIEKHMDHLKKIYSSKAKHLKWLQDKHNQCVISWIRSQVATELESPNNTISDTLRWISHGPSPSVITYSSYVMNGIRYNTEHRDGVRNVQNSGVYMFSSEYDADI
ncbi:transposase [Cucumis melo var. makuwa]|uniref:Transposase n=1 Tax=Cucumis melo var. makuwa TaxID=1194695 RepID=A0A5A7UC40_CUCMM|nr:transposase [Cucumis melo var. makuwa]